MQQQFPTNLLQRLQNRSPGCLDCETSPAEWASVSHGCFLCLRCAGKHRGLGVQISFVRSIYMDSWSQEQIEMMRQGGNDQIKHYFQRMRAENMNFKELYEGKIADHYRNLLKQKVQRVLSGEIPAEPYRHNIVVGSIDIKVCGSDALASSKSTQVTVVFHDGAMGLTLVRDSNGFAIVRKLVVGGQAQIGGVQVGDSIVGVDEFDIDQYNDILWHVTQSRRPINVRFRRNNTQHVISSPISSPVKNPKRSDIEPHSGNDSPIFLQSQTSPRNSISTLPVSLIVSSKSVDFHSSSFPSSSANSRTQSLCTSPRMPLLSCDENAILHNTRILDNRTISPSLEGEFEYITKTSNLVIDSLNLDDDHVHIEESLHLCNAKMTALIDQALNDEEYGDRLASLDTYRSEGILNRSVGDGFLIDELESSGSEESLSFKNSANFVLIDNDVGINGESDSEHNEIEENNNSNVDNCSSKDTSGKSDAQDIDILESGVETESILEIGTQIKVWKKDERKWRSASILKIHTNKTLTVKFKNNMIEKYVSLERIGLQALEVGNEDIDKKSESNSNESNHLSKPEVEKNDFDLDSLNMSFDLQKTEKLTRARSLPIFETKCKDFRVLFVSFPLGLTLETSLNSKGVSCVVVTRVNKMGQAETLGVTPNDILVGVGDVWIDSLQRATTLLASVQLPISLVFRRQYSTSLT